jgi:hypothetical protein
VGQPDNEPEDDIGCKRLGDDPEAWHRATAEAFARLPNLTSDSFADTEFTSVDQPYIDLGDDFWADVQDSVGQPNNEPEDGNREDDDICCELFGPNPDATTRKAAESIARCRNITSNSFADTEFTSVSQPYIDLDDDIWADLQDNMGQSNE